MNFNDTSISIEKWHCQTLRCSIAWILWGERGMQFGDKVVDVNETVVRRLNQIYDDLIIEWNG